MNRNSKNSIKFKYQTLSREMEAPQSLLKFEPSVQIYEQMREYHKQKHLKENDTDIAPHDEQIIDSILPPREWSDHSNKLHIQYVSHQPATREDVLELERTLEQMLEDRQARTSGICGIREELFSQAFDEIIRQVAIDSPERGLLLMRVRDERMMSLAAYETVFQSSVAYGTKKILETENQKGDEEEEYAQLLKKQRELQERKYKLLCDRDLLEKQMRESREWEREKRNEEMNYLKLQEQNMNKFLESVRSQGSNTI